MNNLRIGQILINNDWITKLHFQKVLNQQEDSNLKLNEILVQKSLITRLQVQQVLFQKQLHDLINYVLLMLNTLEFSFFLPLLALPSQHRPRELDNIYIFPRIPIERNRNSKHSDPLDLSTSSWVKQKYLSQVHLPKPTVASPLEGFCHPLNGKGYLLQGIRSGTHQGRMEYAYDLGSPIGTPVYAMRAGRVIGVRDKYPDAGGGKENAFRFNYVQLEHPNGYRSSYIHLQQGFRRRVSIKAGDWVKAGELIAYTGNSGWSTAPHLHIEVSQVNRRSKFSQTVPFNISGTCGTLAQEPA